jgi:hypothetical protein
MTLVALPTAADPRLPCPARGRAECPRMAPVASARLNASPLAPAFATASTLLGVTALGYTGQLIEIDLTAALP